MKRIKPYFTDGKVTLFHGDCRDVLSELGPSAADLLLTDPPYGMGYQNKNKQTIRGDGKRQGVRIVRQALGECERHLSTGAHAYLFTHWEGWPDFYDAAAAFMSIKNALIWWKDGGGQGDVAYSYAVDYEVILFGMVTRARRLTGRRDGCVLTNLPPPGGQVRIHPTEKPTALLERLIKKSCPTGGLVLDPFAGSGSTLLAARAAGRRAIGIEIDEKFCAAAAARLAESGANRPLATGTAILSRRARHAAENHS